MKIQSDTAFITNRLSLTHTLMMVGGVGVGGGRDINMSRQFSQESQRSLFLHSREEVGLLPEETTQRVRGGSMLTAE